MARSRVPSPQTVTVLRALAGDPARWRYGYELVTETELKAGSLYPILVRLADRGLLDAMWEESPPRGRPPRHLYRLTQAGIDASASAAAAASAASGAPAARRARGQPVNPPRRVPRRVVPAPQPDGA
jgi:DNA-binding PadR family transcriptional regulator